MTRSNAFATSSSAASSARSTRLALASLSAVAVAALALLGHVGYDMAYALLWGDQLAHGDLPTLEGAFAPTPHPLANLLGMVVAPLGRPASAEAFGLVIAASLGAVGIATYRIGTRLFGVLGGLLAALVLVTRPALVASTLRGSIDIPALALTLFALDALLEKRFTRALILLGIAGLLRPEAWLLSLAVLLWSRQPRLIGLALAAPVLWCAADWIVTGDPLFSFHGTRDLAEELNRPRSARLAPLLVPRLLAAVIGLPLLLAGTIGLVALSERPSPRFRALLIVLLIALATFVVIGAAGLPLLARYLLPAAAVLAVLGCGAAITPGQRYLRAAAIACLLLAVPGTVKGVYDAVRGSREQRTVQADLRGLRLCGPLSTVTYRLVPILAYGHALAPSEIGPTPGTTAIVLPRSPRAAESLQSASDEAPLLLAPPPGLGVVAHTRDWALAAACRPR